MSEYVHLPSPPRSSLIIHRWAPSLCLRFRKLRSHRIPNERYRHHPSTKKSQQRLYFLPQLAKFQLPQALLVQFSTNTIENMLASGPVRIPSEKRGRPLRIRLPSVISWRPVHHQEKEERRKNHQWHRPFQTRYSQNFHQERDSAF